LGREGKKKCQSVSEGSQWQEKMLWGVFKLQKRGKEKFSGYEGWVGRIREVRPWEQK